MASFAMPPPMPGSFGSSLWDSSPNFQPQQLQSFTAQPQPQPQTMRKIAKPIPRSETLAKTTSLALNNSFDSYNPSKRPKQEFSASINNLASDNFAPIAIRSAENGGYMTSALRAGTKRGAKNDEDEEDEDEDGGMKDSIFSDMNYRRNCGSEAHESDDRGGKRRLLNVVGSVVGSIWQFCTSQMPSSIAGMLPKIGWSTAAAEYYDQPFNAPPGLFDEDNNLATVPEGFVTQPSFARPTVRSILPPSDQDDRFSARSPDYSLLDDEDMMSMSRSKISGTDSPMSASWIMVKTSGSRASSPTPTSPNMGASAARMRRSSNVSLSRPDTPIFSTPPGSYRRQNSYARVVPKKSRVVLRPTVNTSRNSYSMNRSYSTSSGSPMATPNFNISQSTISSYSTNSFNSFGSHASASSATSYGSTPTSPARTNTIATTATYASIAGQQRAALTRAATMSAPVGRSRRDEDNDLDIDSYTRTLQAMIREGKEALGSKFEVEVYDCTDEDNNWV